MITERRQHPRKTPLEFTFIQLEQEFAGHVLNYSQEGLSFETSAPISDSDLVQFWLSFRQQGQIDGVGRITWLNEKRNRGGIAFVHLSRSSRQKVDEWTAAFPEGTVASVAPKPNEEESPTEIVSKIMAQVLTEKRHHLPEVGLPSVGPADTGNATGTASAPAREPERVETSDSLASALLSSSDTTEVVAIAELHITESPETQARESEPIETSDSLTSAVVAAPDTTEPAAMTELRSAELPETSDSGEAFTLTTTADESGDSLNTDAEPTVEVFELDPTEQADLFVPPDLTPATAETDGLWGEAAPPAPEAWHADFVPTLDAPRQNRFEETPAPSVTSSVAPEPADSATTDKVPMTNDGTATNLESAEPAPAVRKWPSATPPVSTTPTVQHQRSRHEDSFEEETRELVPLKQYLYTQRLQFVRGAAIGILLALAIAVIAFKFWKPVGQGASPEETRKAVAANTTTAAGATMPEPASPPAAPIAEAKGSRRSPAGRADLAAPGQPSRNSGGASSDNVAPASAQGASNSPANVIPMPSSFSNRNSTAGGRDQPLFGLTQPSSPGGSTAEGESSSVQPKVGVDLSSTPWSFHRRNIHGAPPVGGDVRPPELIHSAAPHYPQAAKVRQISGDVVIEAIIDARGNVRKPQVVSGPTLLRSAAVDAVLGWKYKPAQLDGKPTEVHETITVKFLPQ